MRKSVRLEVVLRGGETEKLIRSLETVAWIAGDVTPRQEHRSVGQLDWLIAEFRRTLAGESEGAS